MQTFLIAGERDEMDQLLQKELGQEPTKQLTEDNKKPTDKKNEPINPVEERYRREDDSSSLLWTLVKVFFVFGILTAAMYYVLKFVSKNRQSMYPVRDAMRVLASLPLAPNKQIQIVDVSGILLVIGVSDGSVNLIKEIDSSEIKEKIYHSKETVQPPTENFLEVLLSTFKNLDFKASHNTSHKDTEVRDEEIMNEIKFRQLERLEKLKKERSDLSGGKDKDISDSFS
ncbi:MAG TPA: flagellar biosynthetic protein FliO [Leptospiraceae bacterium]|nr:flagellar biosynthetic protein FliO [Leptospiraceae bacterium]HMX31503.1 flagellar biosynthetic protein FliO [Leptospiraceae bacterium]HMY31644.1 flagellar biosynthetic protein FliO [Leptospiraceae bacterium]HMZ62612.1 flagellar biosynthetic protein FliO [Leptospiraceae bacterium]HNA07985.1 flagellar biosynthetic protein FliO [Leptospiraceae bacterium]